MWLIGSLLFMLYAAGTLGMSALELVGVAALLLLARLLITPLLWLLRT